MSFKLNIPSDLHSRLVELRGDNPADIGDFVRGILQAETAAGIGRRQTCAAPPPELMDFPMGSLVWLNSGGPPMTVIAPGCALIGVTWFEPCGHRQEDDIPRACLCVADPFPSDIPF